MGGMTSEADEKTCPDCAETIRAAAKKCRFCGFKFEETVEPDRAKVLGAIVALILIMTLAIVMCSDTTAPAGDGDAEAAADRYAGFHCLSAWDGSHPGVVEWLKKRLREPNSFEHEETRILPVDTKGKHFMTMIYRARNGFGGMNTGLITASVRQSDCGFEVVSAEE